MTSKEMKQKPEAEQLRKHYLDQWNRLDYGSLGRPIVSSIPKALDGCSGFAEKCWQTKQLMDRHKLTAVHVGNNAAALREIRIVADFDREQIRKEQLGLLRKRCPVAVGERRVWPVPFQIRARV